MTREAKVELIPSWGWEAMRLWLDGFSMKIIVREARTNEAELNRFLQSPIAKATMREMVDETINTVPKVQASLQALAPQALEALADAIKLQSKKNKTGNEWRVMVDAAKEVLNMAGNTATRKLQVTVDRSDEKKLADASPEELVAMAREKLKLASDKAKPLELGEPDDREGQT